MVRLETLFASIEPWSVKRIAGDSMFVRRFNVASISGFDLATNAKIERISVCPLAIRHCSVP
jgi:hypothetical protein